MRNPYIFFEASTDLFGLTWGRKNDKSLKKRRHGEAPSKRRGLRSAGGLLVLFPQDRYAAEKQQERACSDSRIAAA